MTAGFPVARQMVAAEISRLSRHRSLMAMVAVLMLVPLLFYLGYNVLEHASDAQHHGPAGGIKNFIFSINLLAVFMGPVAVALIGAESGAGDYATGVFRDQVVTGRSRLALFLAKVPAVIATSIAASAPGLALAIGASYAFAGNLATPDLALVLESAGWLAIGVSVVGLVALGLGSLTGSRPGTIAPLIAWQLVISPNLAQVNSLGHVRDGLLDAAIVFLRPGPAVGNVPALAMSVSGAVAVLACWLGFFSVVGAWRTQTRDA